MLPLIGAGIAAGSSLIGGIMGQNAADENRASQERIAAQNIAMQREFAQQGIRWKVADATAAGVHPLYALGAQTHSFAPVSVGSSSASPMGSAIASMGQDVGRALKATTTPDEQALAISQQAQSLQLDNMALQNQLLASKIRQINQPATGPGVPPLGGFEVPEDKKVEPRPPLMLGGERWNTNPNTSPMDAWTKQYGDEGPVAASMPLAILYNDLMFNSKHGYHPDNWMKNAMTYLDRAADRHINNKEVQTIQSLVEWLYNAGWKGRR